MKIRIMEPERKFDEAAAWIIIGQMLKKPDSVIGLSTGKTTGNMHAIVSQLYELHHFDTSQVTVFNVDELAGLPRSYKGSCYAMIKSQICQPLHIKEENFIMPRTMDIDFEKECLWFEEELKKFHPSLEVEDAEEAIYNQDLTDAADLLVKMIKESEEKEEK